MNLSRIARNLAKSVKKHSPEILTGLGIAGMITATVFAVKATPKAVILIEKAKKEQKVEKLTPVETVKTCWKCYVPTVATTVLSTACLIGSTSISVRRHTALMTAYALSETTLKEYQDKVVETIGEKKEQLIRDEIAQDHIDRDPVSKADVIPTRHGNTLCYDPFGGGYFRSDIDKLKKAMIEVNHLILKDGYASLNDYYYEIDRDNTTFGSTSGWKVESGRVDIKLSSRLADTGEPCVVLGFSPAPAYGFNN